jgi:hypothetical protein
MAWQLRDNLDFFKMWQNTRNYRRIQITRIGFDPEKAEWNVEVENGRGKKGFTTEAKAVAFAKQRMKELDVPENGRKAAAGTGTLYRPRGIDKETRREKWITTDWYRSKKDALYAVKMFNSEKWFKSIKIMSAPNHQYKGRYIRANQISTMF